jgi:spore coat protein CotH
LQTVRTLFLDFENADWEKELSDFRDTDVDVPAKLTADGKIYEGVGVHFRGASSYMMIGEGRKRSLNLSLDLVNEDQRLGGYRTLNLLNSNADPTMMRTVLYHQIAREYIAAPKANWVRVVINGESWGVYVNAQQFNKDFIEEWFGTKKGDRWKAPGRPNGNSGLEYLGDDVAEYRKRFEIKSKDDPKAWEALAELCRVLNQTPADQLVEKLSPLLDIDGTLKYLALDNAFINNDGYWTRASDYSLYRDPEGRFHIIPHDVNETFRAPEDPGMQGRTKGVELDPLAGADDANKPLLSKLLAVPELRTRYLKSIGEITTQWLDWNELGPLAQQYQALIAEQVKIDTRKLAPYEAFVKGVSGDAEEQGLHGPQRAMSLKSFVEQRRDYLLNHPEIKKALQSAPES